MVLCSGLCSFLGSVDKLKHFASEEVLRETFARVCGVLGHGGFDGGERDECEEL